MLILILLSTYNGEKYLNAQLESLLKQEGVETHLLVRDDGSHDATLDILKAWKEKYPAWIDIIKGDNVGFAMSFTYLLQSAVSKYSDVEYMAFCDQDDVWLPEKLKVALEKLRKENEAIPISYCSNTRLVDVNLNFIRFGWRDNEVQLSKERSLIQNFATGCTMVFNRKAAEIYVSHLPEKIKVHDFLMYQLCMFLGKVIYDKKSYILYRQHGYNQIGKPDFIGRWKKRMKGHYKEHVFENLNSAFLSAYKSFLSLDDIFLISKVVFYRKGFWNRLILLFDNKISYTTFEANFFLKIKIVLGCL